jgi:signal transduction histidine kinase
VKLPTSRIALRIYAIGLVQFLIVAAVLEVSHRIAVVAAVILVVVGVGAYVTARSFAQPLVSLTETTRAFGKGNLEARTKSTRQDEIGELSRAFDDMADRLGRLIVAERELLANVSHELRTPLARIRVALDIASESDGKSGISLADIAQDLAELERIVEDVLASARLAVSSGGALPMRTQPGDVRALLDKSVALFQLAHPDRVLETKLPDTLGTMNADPVLLRRVIDNLLENAHKYTDKPDRAITLQAKLDGETVVIDVIDRGIGISEDDQKRLFEPFFRVDRSRARATGGLGLGLLLARRIVEAHGGTLTIASVLNEGTSATVTLPITT